jgi:hypothetical protein
MASTELSGIDRPHVVNLSDSLFRKFRKCQHISEIAEIWGIFAMVPPVPSIPITAEMRAELLHLRRQGESWDQMARRAGVITARRLQQWAEDPETTTAGRKKYSDVLKNLRNPAGRISADTEMYGSHTDSTLPMDELAGMTSPDALLSQIAWGGEMKNIVGTIEAWRMLGALGSVPKASRTAFAASVEDLARAFSNPGRRKTQRRRSL